MRRWIGGAKPFVLILSGILLAGEVSGCSLGGYEIEMDAAKEQERTIFSINDRHCSEAEARLYLCNYRELYGDAYGVDLWTYDFKDSLEKYVKEVTIDELSRVYCMEQIAEQKGLQLDEEENRKADQAAERYYDSLSEEAIEYIGMGKGELRKFYTHYAMAVKLYKSMTGGEVDEVSDDEARVIQIRQIYTRDLSKAEAIKKKLASGKDFQSLAGTYNETKQTDLTVARGQLEEVLEKTVFELENDQISDIVTAGNGYYIFQCVSKYDKNLTEKNKQLLTSDRREKKFTDTYGEFIKASGYEFNKEEWQAMPMPPEAIHTNTFFQEYEGEES